MPHLNPSLKKCFFADTKDPSILLKATVSHTHMQAHTLHCLTISQSKYQDLPLVKSVCVLIDWCAYVHFKVRCVRVFLDSNVYLTLCLLCRAPAEGHRHTTLLQTRLLPPDAAGWHHGRHKGRKQLLL